MDELELENKAPDDFDLTTEHSRKTDSVKAIVRNNVYYYLVFIMSVIVLTVGPMLGSQAGLEIPLPDTIGGWITYCTVKIAVAVINVMIFHCFVMQARVNVKDDPRYIEAMRLMDLVNNDLTDPRSPETYFHHIYKTKGTSVFISTLVSAVALTNMILTYDLMSLITYAMTIAMGVVYGIMKMHEVEDYWVIEFLEYARKRYREMMAAQKGAENATV